MSITVNCPECGKRYDLEDRMAGMRVRCKACATVFRIPSPEPETLRAAPRFDEDELPPPKRAAIRRPAKKAGRRNAEIPPLVRFGLTLLAGLIAVPLLGLLAMGIVKGNPQMVRIGVAILSVYACLGLAIVCHLKLLFMAVDEAASHGVPSVFAWIYIPAVVFKRWDQTGRYALGWLAGVAGLIVWCVLVPPHLKGGRGGPGGDDSFSGHGDGRDVRMIVTNLPSMEAYKAVGEQVNSLVDPGSGHSVRSSFSTGKPAVFDVWPVAEPESLRDRIHFGTVTKISGHQVTVQAAPIAVSAKPSAPAVNEEPSPFRKVASGSSADAKASPFRRVEAGTPFSASKPSPDADALTRLVFELRDPDRGKRKRAVQSLLQMSPEDDRREEVQNGLRPLLEDEEGFLVNDTIKALGRWHTEETVPALIPLTTDRRFDVRWQAIETLGSLQDERAAEAIADRLKDDGIKAEPALRALGVAAEPALITRLKSPDPDVRRKACDVLKEIGGKETLQFMSTARPDPDLGVRMAAQNAMQEIAGRVGTNP